jgi:hypothetical protein
MARNRNMWIGPALLGAFLMARSRSGRRTPPRRGMLDGRGILGQLSRGRSRRGGFGSMLLEALMGRRTGARAFR